MVHEVPDVVGINYEAAILCQQEPLCFREPELCAECSMLVAGCLLLYAMLSLCNLHVILQSDTPREDRRTISLAVPNSLLEPPREDFSKTSSVAECKRFAMGYMRGNVVKSSGLSTIIILSKSSPSESELSDAPPLDVDELESDAAISER